MKDASRTTTACRSCGEAGLRRVLDLGRMPLADALLSEADLAAPEPRFPLVVAYCPACSLVQITETVDPDLLFRRDYPYYSSFSDALLAHSRENALELARARNLGPRSLVVEVASNDGYLLRNFAELGIPALGIDPAEGPVRAARERGIETLCEYFGTDLARRLRSEGKRADVILGNNVLAHVADTNGFVEGVRTLLAEEGVAVFEVPYVRDLIEKCEFDTIYHEHLCYFSVTSIDRLFRRHSLYLNEVRRIPIHGGSLRAYLEPRERPGPSVRALLEEERRLGLDRFESYAGFGERVSALRDDLRSLLLAEKEAGRRIAAYGAAAKGATLLNYAGLGREVIDFVVDRNVHKHGRYMPGARIPIRPPEALLEEKPDLVLLLAWNFRDEILAQQAEYRRRGGRFVVPVPRPEILG